MKTIWLSSLIRDEERVKKLMNQLKTYGLDVKGHFWEDDLEKMVWMNARSELIKSEVTLWLILASPEGLTTPSIRYGLSLLAMTLQAKRGVSFPVVILLPQGEPPSNESLPTLFKGADFLPLADPGMAAKLVVKVHSPSKETAPEYRLDVYGSPHIGQWFEIGPRNGPWSGAMFGIPEGEIAFHAVGPKGSLPEQSQLHYPVRGLKLNLGGKEYTAWAAQNELNSQTSYFVKVNGFPETILFGSYATQEEGEVYVVRLK